MALPRYAVVDAYILEELRLQYQSSNAKERIRFLRQLSKGGRADLPYEIALMAVEDQNIEVRQWIARHGNIYPDSELWSRLENDPHPFVRACLRENRGNWFARGRAAMKDATKYFCACTHLERLALVRNPGIDEELIKKIFDHEDKELGIDLQERQQLIFAFLTNAEMLSERVRWAGLSGHPMPRDAWTWHDGNKFLTTLWELASKWPSNGSMYVVQYWVYRYVPAEDKTKARIYRTCDVLVWREAILMNCDWRDTETLKLGMEDRDARCHFSAYSGARVHEPDIVKVLFSMDVDALWGLAENQSLSVANLKKVRDRLRELDHDTGLDAAERTIEQVQKIRAPEDPEQLFGSASRENNFLEDKIDFIGKKLLSFERELTEYFRETHLEVRRVYGYLNQLLFIGVSIAVVAILTLLFK